MSFGPPFAVDCGVVRNLETRNFTMPFRNRLLIVTSLLLVFAVLSTCMVLSWWMRRSMMEQTRESGLQVAEHLARTMEFAEQIPGDMEKLLADQMVVQATIAAHLVAIAEKAGLSPQEINRHLQEITESTTLDEFWITDEKGRAYLRNMTAINFAFDSDPKKQPQAHIFFPLLEGKTNVVIQKAMRREVDDQIFKYVAVPGVDKPRIVQVGYNARLIAQMNQTLGLPRVISTQIKSPSVESIHVLDEKLKTLAFGSRASVNLTQAITVEDADMLARVVKTLQPEVRQSSGNLLVMAPILTQEKRVAGAARISMDTSGWEDQIQKSYLICVIVAAVTLVVGLITTLFLSRKLAD